MTPDCIHNKEEGKMATTKRDGGANIKYWDSPDVLDQLDNVRNWLIKNCKKV